MSERISDKLIREEKVKKLKIKILKEIEQETALNNEVQNDTIEETDKSI